MVFLTVLECTKWTSNKSSAICNKCDLFILADQDKEVIIDFENIF
jgi:hypothetical protein